jgi:hypothetical protein
MQHMHVIHGDLAQLSQIVGHVETTLSTVHFPVLMRTHVQWCSTGVFNSFKGAYDFQLQPTVVDTYLAVITIRHPNVSSSFVLTTFHISVSPNPVAAAGDAASNTSTAAGTAAVTAASVALFNPLVNPRLVCSISLPRLLATSNTGGPSKLLADFNSIVTSNALLAGPTWVQSSLTRDSPVTVNATVSLQKMQRKETGRLHSCSAKSL